jgi:transcriptional regulator with XRE-family HTH domain
MLLRHALGEQLRHARRDSGMSIRALSAAAGVSIGYLSEIERGRKEVSSEILAAICRALSADTAMIVSAAANRMAVPAATVVPMPRAAAAAAVSAA